MFLAGRHLLILKVMFAPPHHNTHKHTHTHAVSEKTLIEISPCNIGSGSILGFDFIQQRFFSPLRHVV